MFTPNQIKTTIRPNTFTAQDAGIYSNAEFDQFWNRFFFSKHSDTTLQLLGKAFSYTSVLLILQTILIHRFLKQILILLFVLDYMINS